MQLIASSDGKEFWLRKIQRPYSFESPFGGEQFVCIIFANDRDISDDEQTALSDQLVSSGCRYALCAGYDCSSWDDSIDWSALAKSDFSESDDDMVMTTWHEDETTSEVIDFALSFTNFDDHVFKKYLVLMIGKNQKVIEEVKAAISHMWKVDIENLK